jgi:hypothetical protein
MLQADKVLDRARNCGSHHEIRETVGLGSIEGCRHFD